jgi:AraC-like DNA-binding protein
MRQFFCHAPHQTRQSLHLAYISKVETYDEVYIRGIHKHDHITEISLIQHGSGRYFIRDGNFAVQQHNAVVINAGQLHSEGAILPSICIGIHTPNVIAPNAYPIIQFNDQEFTILAQLGELAFQLLQQPDPAQHQLASNLILTSLLPYFTAQIPPHQPMTSTNAFIVTRAKDYIDQHFHEAINITRVCQELSISHTYLDKQFQENMTFKPIQYLTSRRVGEAQRLLINAPALSLTQVSLAVGITNVNYFQRIFKNFAGVSPQRFRTLLTMA